AGADGQRRSDEWKLAMLDDEHPQPVGEPPLDHRRHAQGIRRAELRRLRGVVVRRGDAGARVRERGLVRRARHHTGTAGEYERRPEYEKTRCGTAECLHHHEWKVHRAPPDTMSSVRPVGTTVSVTRGFPRYSRATR